MGLHNWQRVLRDQIIELDFVVDKCDQENRRVEDDKDDLRHKNCLRLQFLGHLDPAVAESLQFERGFIEHPVGRAVFEVDFLNFLVVLRLNPHECHLSLHLRVITIDVALVGFTPLYFVHKAVRFTPRLYDLSQFFFC